MVDYEHVEYEDEETHAKKQVAAMQDILNRTGLTDITKVDAIQFMLDEGLAPELKQDVDGMIRQFIRD